MERKLKVFITIDTEVWRFYDNFVDNFNSSVYGKTEEGDFGLDYQLALFDEYQLKANFFVEPLFSLDNRDAYLKEVVRKIAYHEQEIGLHIHTEWLNQHNNFLSCNTLGNNMWCFSKHAQKEILAKGVALLRQAGASDICAFRAGNYGGDTNTLRALNEMGINVDTTYNQSYLRTQCMMDIGKPLFAPQTLYGTHVYPVTCFQDFPRHLRHLQVTACSFTEMRNVLEKKWQAQHDSVVIVLHTFEWIKRIQGSTPRHVLDDVCLNRFIRLCQYLNRNQHKFDVAHFSEVAHHTPALSQSSTPIKSNLIYTAGRLFRQIYRRVALQ